MSNQPDNLQTALAIPPFLRLAFRPLFLLGTLFALFAIAWWTHYWVSPNQWSPFGGPIWWHGHEMIFGFGSAIVVGFLLTAVQNWTGVTGLRGLPLALLSACWLSARILLAFNLTPHSGLIMLVDVGYFVVAAAAMAYPVIKVKQWRNLMFTPILLILGLLNLASYWSVLASEPEYAIRALHAAVLLISLVVAIIGGRVIPAFTCNGTGCPRAPGIAWLEIVSIAGILAMLVLTLLGLNQLPAWLVAGFALLTGLANAIRFSRWGIQYTFPVPLLWSLHFSYLFLPIGYVMIGLYYLGLVHSFSAAIHAITVGSIGGMILAMISRVTLGHTGRPLNPPLLMNLSYMAIILAACVRAFIPAWFPSLTLWGIAAAGALWVIAFSIFVYYYAPMLVTQRADGRPG